jgi:hypothetical protein
MTGWIRTAVANPMKLFTNFRNKLEWLSLASHSSLVLCLSVRPGAHPSVEFLKGSSHGKALALPTNIRLVWKGLPGPNTLAITKSVNYGCKIFHRIGSWACIIKLITAVIYSFCNKLQCLSLNTILGCKGVPGTNTLAYYRNRKLRP